MSAVGDRNAGGAATVAEPFAGFSDRGPAGNLAAYPNLHVIDQESKPAAIASLLKRGDDRQPVDRLHRRLLHRPGERPSGPGQISAMTGIHN